MYLILLLTYYTLLCTIHINTQAKGQNMNNKLTNDQRGIIKLDSRLKREANLGNVLKAQRDLVADLKAHTSRNA